MRHMGRTHGVNLAMLNNDSKLRSFVLAYIVTTEMAADIFTKFYPKSKKETWRQMCDLVCVCLVQGVGRKCGGKQATAT